MPFSISGPGDVPLWPDIIRHLLAEGHTDDALIIARMLEWNTFCDELIGETHDARDA